MISLEIGWRMILLVIQSDSLYEINNISYGTNGENNGFRQKKDGYQLMKMIRQYKKALKEILTPGRYEHTLGVEYTAACLAMRYGEDLTKTRIAALLHDCAKCIPAKDQLHQCRDFRIPISPVEEANPDLLHAKLGAWYAREKYGIEDPEILSAIYYHTTGKPDMTLLEKIIYIADYMEPNRNKASNLDQVRKEAFLDLDRCLLTILQSILDYLNSREMLIDPLTEETCHYYRRLLTEGKNTKV